MATNCTRDGEFVGERVIGGRGGEWGRRRKEERGESKVIFLLLNVGLHIQK